MPKVSIILPVYNVEKFIAKAIQSVLNQTFQDFELLVIIDGSPDNSKQIAEGVNDPRITIYEKENGGLSDARNYGLDHATGQFIYFMDSDDWIESNLLQDNIKIIEQENLDFIVFGYIQDNENIQGKVISSYPILPKNQAFKKGEHIDLDTHHLGILGYAWNKIYRKSFLDQHKFRFQKGISLVEDILFNAPIYQVSNTIYFNHKAYYHYINRDVETLMKRFYPNAFELKVLKNIALEKFLREWNIINCQEILANSLFGGIKFCIDNLYKNRKYISKKERENYLNAIVCNKRFKDLSINLKLDSFKDKLFYKVLILNNDALMQILKFKK